MYPSSIFEKWIVKTVISLKRKINCLINCHISSCAGVCICVWVCVISFIMLLILSMLNKMKIITLLCGWVFFFFTDKCNTRWKSGLIQIHSAQTVHNAQQWFVPSPGALSWLDGSRITYSNWASRPQTEAACGHILKDSGFQWEATADCSKKLHFICQFGMYSSDSYNDSEIWTEQPTESLHDDLLLCTAFLFFPEPGRSIVCADHNTTLQCASGQVLIIGSGFYGHKNSHYCRSSFSLPTTSLPHQCGWTDVGQTITGNRQYWFSVCSLKKHSFFTCYNVWVKWSVLPLDNTQQLMDLTDTISTLKPPSFMLY